MAAKRKGKGRKPPGSTIDEGAGLVAPLPAPAAVEVARRPYAPPTLTSSTPEPRPSVNVQPAQFAMNEDPACGDSPTGGSDDD